MIMTTGLGWFGTAGELISYLLVTGADCDAEGRWLLAGDAPASFLGINQGTQTEIAVGSDVVYFVNGQARSLATGLRATSHGFGAVMIQ